MPRRLAVLLLLLALPGPAAADTGAHGSPYSGLQDREVKALSPQEIADLQSGAGMSMALAAELNGFPGPRHVLDLSDPLGLSPEQAMSVRALFDAMEAEAAALGAAVVAGEAELERGFRSGALDAEAMTATVMAIAEARGRLRAAHLRYHLATRDLLDRHQLALYDQLRGYGDGHHRHRH